MNIFGQIKPPEALSRFTGTGGDVGAGFGAFLNLIFQLAIVGGGIYALFKIILAGYAFLSAGDDPKAIEGAWARIWQSMIGLVLIAGAFVLAAIFGRIFFGSYDAIINPVIPTLNQIQTEPQPGLPIITQ
jgi:hypothetical protein